MGRGPLVFRGPLPGGPRPMLGIEKFFYMSHASQSMKRYQVLLVELELPLYTLKISEYRGPIENNSRW